MPEEKICFIISRIGSEGSEERIDADRKLKFVFTPTLEKLGYVPIRADDEDSPGSISKKIVLRLIDSPLVIADITGNNPNVFYELAIRNAVGKPVIIIKDPSQKPPFDIQDIRCISIDMTDPEVWQKGIISIEKLIINAQKEPDQASSSILSDFLKSFQLDSDKKITGEERSIFEIQDLKSEIKDLREDLASKMRPSIAHTADPESTARAITATKREIEFLETISRFENGAAITHFRKKGLPLSITVKTLQTLEKKGLIKLVQDKTIKTYMITNFGRFVLSTERG